MLVKDILLHLFFIITPIFFFQSIWLDQHRVLKRISGRYMIGLYSAISLVLCMTFPISVNGGMIHDLRAIPIFIAFLYGGYLPGIAVSLIMLVYRYFLGGGDGFYMALLAFVMYIILPVLLVHRWNAFSRQKKILIFMAMGVVREVAACIATFLVTYYETGLLSVVAVRLQSHSLRGIISILVTGVVIMLIEYVRENSYIRNQIYKTEKLNLISELAASVAHEVRNPITVVRGFVQLFREGSNSRNQEYIRLILTELDRAEFIISDYLNLAKTHSEVIETFDVGKKLEEVVVFMSAYALMRGVEIKLEMKERLFINADPIKIKQVFMNIIKNGIEAMASGGSINVKAALVNQHAVISICDTGEGMSKAQLEQLGKPFFSTKETGTGLGMLVTYGIVQSLGGKIEVESERGKGTTVTVHLPTVGQLDQA